MGYEGGYTVNRLYTHASGCGVHMQHSPCNQDTELVAYVSGRLSYCPIYALCLVLVQLPIFIYLLASARRFI